MSDFGCRISGDFVNVASASRWLDAPEIRHSKSGICLCAVAVERVGQQRSYLRRFARFDFMAMQDEHGLAVLE